MQISRFVGLALASLLLFAVPALAAAPPAYDPVPHVSAPAVLDDCAVSFEPTRVLLFTEATGDCDPLMAEATGLCLVEVSATSSRPIDAAYDPLEAISCAGPGQLHLVPAQPDRLAAPPG